MELNIFKLPDHNSPEFITYLKRLHKKGKDILADPKLQELILAMEEKNLVNLFYNNLDLFKVPKNFKAKQPFFDKLLDRCEKEDLFIKYQKLYSSIYYLLNEFETEEKNFEYIKKLLSIDVESAKKFITLCDIEGIDFYINGYYDLVIKNNNNKTYRKYYLTIKTFDSVYDLLKVLEEQGLSIPILNGECRITSFKRNEIKNRLIITFDATTKPKKTVVINCLINGKPYKFRISLDCKNNKGFYYYDLNTHPQLQNINITSAEMKDIVHMESQNITVPNVLSLHEIQFKNQDGTIITRYLTSDKNGLLDIDTLMVEENITGDFYNIFLVKPKELLPQIQDKVNIDSPIAQDIYSQKKYGGSQGNVRKYVTSRLLEEKDGIIRLSDVNRKHSDNMIKVIKKYFPNATSKDIKNIAYAFTEKGCGYIKFANHLCCYFGNLETGENIFKQTFNFNLYELEGDGNKSYSMECLALELFLKYHIKILKRENTNDLLDNAKGFLIDASDILPRLLKLYGLAVNYKCYSGDFSTELLSGIILNSSNSFFSIVLDKYYLYYNNTSNIAYDKTNSFHGMNISEISNHNEIFVSSWGGKYILGVKPDAKVYIETYSFKQLQLDTSLIDELIDTLLNKDIYSIGFILDKIGSIDEDNLPNGFLTVEKFKYYILNFLKIYNSRIKNTIKKELCVV